MEISGVGIFTALSAGLISFLSPCVLPLVPGYLSYIAGSANNGQTQAERHAILPVLLLGVCFVLGFSTIFIALGATAVGLSRFLMAYHAEANMVGGSAIIFFGLLTTGVLRIPFLQRDFRFHGAIRGGNPLGAYLLGVAFGFGWTPCIGPVLGAILTVSAVSSTAAGGVVLLALYSAGLAVPFLLFAVFTHRLTAPLMAMKRAGRILQIAAGGIMVAMGIAMMTGKFTTFSFWLFYQFPIFSQIG